MTRYLSGIQPSGDPHIGNYFGAIEPHIKTSQTLAPEDSAFFFIADYHALTTFEDAETLERRVRAVAATYLALGLDVEKTVFFRQSDIPEVTELTWLLSSVTGMGLLERAHSYKDKVEKGIAASVGLFTYPVLMAADILIYDSDVVPVGRDQQQHVEMTQDMATHFNTKMSPSKSGANDDDGGILRYPKWTFSETPKVPGTDGEKMSKSYNNTIELFLEGKALKKAVNRIVTDSRLPEEAKDPDSIAAVQILKTFLSKEEGAHWEERIREGGEGAPGYGHIKKEIMAQMDAYFGDGRAKYRYYLEDSKGQSEVDDVLNVGAKQAREVAQGVLARCYDACGMGSAARRCRR